MAFWIRVPGIVGAEVLIEGPVGSVDERWGLRHEQWSWTYGGCCSGLWS